MSKKNDWGATTLLFNTPILMGDNTIPGLRIPKEIEEVIPTIFKAADDFGLDYYETIIEWMAYDGISEVAAYDGFPQRIPHWRFGMAYEELSKGYEFGQHRIFEMVINNRPCVIYCLNSNTYTDNVTVIGHALGHNDFFKNNVFFGKTNTKMMNEFGNNRTRVLQIMARWGEEEVEAFLDDCYAIESLIDPASAWNKTEYTDPVIYDEREYHFPRRLKVPEGHDYMEDWINPKDWINEEWERIKKEERKKSLGIIEMYDKDIVKFLLEHAPLKPWEQTILGIVYDEALYFAPQGMTKMANEGWASFVDFNLMARIGMPNCSIWAYADHKARVLGGKFSENPYKLGFELLLDIEERWNKGRFGREYEKCKDNQAKEKWDLQLGLGHQKVFEIRERYNDVTMLAEFFTEDFCRKHDFFNWEKRKSPEPGVEAEYKLVDRDWKKVRNQLIQRYLNRGLPEIRLVDPNGKGKNILVVQHTWDGRTLAPKYSREALRSLARIWRNPVALLTKTEDGKDTIFSCSADLNVVKELKRNEWLQM
jgi:stage V sporulation protein R